MFAASTSRGDPFDTSLKHASPQPSSVQTGFPPPPERNWFDAYVDETERAIRSSARWHEEMERERAKEAAQTQPTVAATVSSPATSTPASTEQQESNAREQPGATHDSGESASGASGAAGEGGARAEGRSSGGFMMGALLAASAGASLGCLLSVADLKRTVVTRGNTFVTTVLEAQPPPSDLGLVSEFQRRALALRPKSDNYAAVFAEALVHERHPLHAEAVQLDEIRRAWRAYIELVATMADQHVLSYKELDIVFARERLRDFLKFIRPLDAAYHLLVERDGFKPEFGGTAMLYRGLTSGRYEMLGYLSREDTDRYQRWHDELAALAAKPPRRWWWFW